MWQNLILQHCHVLSYLQWNSCFIIVKKKLKKILQHWATWNYGSKPCPFTDKYIVLVEENFYNGRNPMLTYSSFSLQIFVQVCHLFGTLWRPQTTKAIRNTRSSPTYLSTQIVLYIVNEIADTCNIYTWNQLFLWVALMCQWLKWKAMTIRSGKKPLSVWNPPVDSHSCFNKNISRSGHCFGTSFITGVGKSTCILLNSMSDLSVNRWRAWNHKLA